MTSDLRGFLSASDLDNKISELSKLITKRQNSQQASFLIDEEGFMGTKEVMTLEPDLTPIHRLSESEEMSQSDIKVPTLHFSKNSSRQPESKSNLPFWDKGKLLFKKINGFNPSRNMSEILE